MTPPVRSTSARSPGRPRRVSCRSSACSTASPISRTGHASFAIACFAVGAVGIYAGLPVFWTLPAARLAGTAQAGGIALINSIDTLSGFVGPVLLGSLELATGGYAAGLIAVAASLAAAGALSFAAR